jgi:hypothetical protein
VLVLATTAFSKINAWRLNASRRRIFDAQQFGPRKLLSHFRNLDFDRFALQHKRNKHDQIVVASNAFSAKGDVVNPQENLFSDLKRHYSFC